MGNYDHLLSPIRIGNVDIRNRVMMTAHVTNFAADDGTPSERHVAYYGDRAKGGIGLIVMGFPGVHETSRNNAREIDGYTDAVIPGLRRIADEVHRHGARMFMQLGHSGRQQSGLWTKREIWAPSAIPCPLVGEMPKAMEPEDLDEIVDGHAATAVRAMKAGMDGVEIHSGYGGYLLSSFVSPYMNRRDDEYGGSLENRLRLVHRTLSAVRDAVGPDFIVGIQVQGHDYSPDGIELPEAQEVARSIAASGTVDYMVVKASTYGSDGQNIPDMQHPRALWLDLATAIKEAVPEMPIFAVGRLNDPDLAEQIVRSGHADMVAMTRQHISDPETVNKLMEGRRDDVRGCIACNQGCLDMLFKAAPVTCVHNPAAGNERELGLGTLIPAERAKRVVVVGGGPAGMKAAEIATRRGHEVTLLERRDQLGGQLRLAASVEGREDFGETVRWLSHTLDQLRVDVRLGVDADGDAVLALSPDAVVVATGSAPARKLIGNQSFGIWEVPGLDADHVLSVWDVLEDGAAVGNTVLVVDDGEGSWKSASIALQLVGRGHTVLLATTLPYVGAKLGAFTQQKLLGRLFASGIEMHPFTTVTGVEGDAVDVMSGGAARRLTGIDTVVLAGWHAPVTDTYFSLKGRVAELERIGDALASRTMLEAIHEGERVGRAL